MNIVILFVISALPVFLLGFYIYRKDRNKEPVKILTKLFLAGVASCFLVLLITFVLGLLFPLFLEDGSNLNLLELIIYVFIGIALVEEFCKWLMTYSITFSSNEFDEMYDMIVYAGFVALGFAFFENLLYVYQHGMITGIIRAILAVPGHACYGIFMGYYLGVAKISSLNERKDLKIKNIFLSIIVPTIMHGIYDYCLYTQNILFMLIFFTFVILVYIFSIKKVKRVSSITKKIKYRYKYCPNCGQAVDSEYCRNCGNKNE